MLKINFSFKIKIVINASKIVRRVSLLRIERYNYINAINPDKPKDRFQKGKRFLARIKNITREGAELEVEEGIMYAKLEKPIGMGIGDIVEFEITDRNEEKITLKVIKNDDTDSRFDIRI